MEFIKKLVQTKDTETTMKMMHFNENTTFRMFEGIKINDDLWLSIQASYGHYCDPRKTIKDLSEYDAMEFALMDREGDFLSVTDVLPDFPKLKEIEEYNQTVYGFVPVSLIEEVYLNLIN